MKVIRNKTNLPLRVPLGVGKVLHLGPRQTGNVADDAPQSDAIRRLIKSKKIEVVGAEDDSPETVAAGSAPREVSHGHTHATRIVPRGNRGG